ncbi:MAG: sensor histidine kinase [Vibrio sp.]
MSWFKFWERSATSSIKRNLVNSISIVFALILFAVYLSVDLSVDTWADNQFDKALINKANYMKSLVKVESDHLVFDDDLMAGHEGDDTHYYQLWANNMPLQRSQTLEPYPNFVLLNPQLPLNTTQLLDVTLPTGEQGRALLSYFLPESEQLASDHEHPAYLALYQATDSLEYILILIDVLLVVTFFISIFVMRYIAIRIVDRGLKPLLDMIDAIKRLDVSQGETMEITSSQKAVEEIEPIRKEFNAFIKSNQVFLQNEKRLTGDIAHELKTPIAEIMSLSEVSIRYPDDPRISATYKQDMLKISQKMKKIVDNLLLLQRSSSDALNLESSVFDLYPLTHEVMEELAFKYPTIQQRIHLDIPEVSVFGDAFSLHSILTNLLDNALFYSPEDSVVEIKAEQQSGCITLAISNRVSNPLSEEDVEHLLEPMYRADQARTSNDRHGLGLSIVNNLCHCNEYQFSMTYQEPNICFSIQSIKVA